MWIIVRIMNRIRIRTLILFQVKDENQRWFRIEIRIIISYLAIPRGHAIETLQLVVEISSSLSWSLSCMTFLVTLWSRCPFSFIAFRRSAGESFSTEGRGLHHGTGDQYLA